MRARNTSASRTLAVLCLAVLTYSMSQTTVIPAIGPIQHQLHISSSSAAWVLTAYLVSASIATGLLGRLGDILGKKRILVTVLGLFALGSLICAVAQTIDVLIGGRVVQGAAGGLLPLAFGIIRDEFPREKVAGSIGLVSAILGIGGGAALVLGGLIVDNGSFHDLFWLSLVLTLIALAATVLWVPESPVRVEARVDWLGGAIFSVGLAAPLIAISEANTWGWGSVRTLGLLAAGLGVLAAFVVLERRRREPLIDMRLLAQRPVWTTNLTAVFVGFGMFGSFLLIPQMAETPLSTGYGLGYDATHGGLLLLPATLMMLLSGFPAARLTAAHGPKAALLVGCLVTAAGLGLLTVLHGDWAQIAAAMLLLGTGIGFAFAAMPNLIVEAVQPTRTGEATGVNTIARSVGSSLGGQISATLLVSITLLSGLPRESAYTSAFAMSAAVALLAFACGLLIPGRARQAAAQQELLARGEATLEHVAAQVA
ncbi:MAG: MFS transporter [Solirubrobacteraceae bacterium]